MKQGPILGAGWIKDSMTLCSFFKDGKEHHMLCDLRGAFAYTRKDVEELIQVLQTSLVSITDEDIALHNKASMLSCEPYWFLEQYGSNDPMWVEYIARHPELNQPRTKKVRKSIPGYVYVIKGGEHCKIGRTQDCNQRVKAMAVQAPFALETLVLLTAGDMHAVEAELHETFATKRIRGEWFNLDEEDIDYIRRHYDITDPSRLNVK